MTKVGNVQKKTIQQEGGAGSSCCADDESGGPGDMESTFRPEVQAFIQNCQKLAGLTHQNELTQGERRPSSTLPADW